MLVAAFGGCTSFQASVIQRAELEGRCAHALAGETERELPRPYQLLSLRLEAPQLCSDPGASGSKPAPLPSCALKDFANRHAFCDSGTCKSSADKVETSLQKLRNALDKLDAAIDGESKNCTQPGQGRGCRTRHILGTDAGTQLATKVLSELGAARSAVAELRRDLEAAAAADPAAATRAKLSAAAKYEYALWEANLLAVLARIEQVARGDVQQILSDASRDYVVTHSARKTLDVLHRALRPMDQALNRLDDRSYGGISLSYILFSNGLSGAIDEIVGKLREQNAALYAQFAEFKTGNGFGSAADAALAAFTAELQRAACRDMRQRTELSILSDLANVAIVSKLEPRQAAVIGRSPGTGDKKHTRPAQLYVANEWAAREVLLRRQLQGTLRGTAWGGGAAEPAAAAPIPVLEPVSELTVEQLAASATADVVDNALRFDAGPVAAKADDKSPRSLSTLPIPQASLTPTAAAQNVAAAYASISALIAIANVNTNTNTFAPVIHVTPPAQPATAAASAPDPQPELCAALRTLTGIACRRIGTHHELVLHHYFGSAECQSGTVNEAAASLAQAVRDHANRTGTQYEATVEGYASRRAMHAPGCLASGAAADKPSRPAQPASTGGVPIDCVYTSPSHKRLLVQGCGGADANVQLAAGRAIGIAQQLETASSGAILVRELVAHGSRHANLQAGQDDAAGDRAVMLRLVPTR